MGKGLKLATHYGNESRPARHGCDRGAQEQEVFNKQGEEAERGAREVALGTEKKKCVSKKKE